MDLLKVDRLVSIEVDCHFYKKAWRCWATGTSCVGRSVFHGNSLVSGFFPDLFSDFVLRRSKFQGVLDGECIDADFVVDPFCGHCDAEHGRFVFLVRIAGRDRYSQPVVFDACSELSIMEAFW